MRILILSSLIILLGLTSCKKELPFPDTMATDNIVVSSLFSPEMPFNVHVGTSFSINDTTLNDNFIGDAQVVLKDEQGDMISTLIHQGDGLYSNSSVVIDHNKTYEIEVMKNGELITAMNKVPQAFICNYIGHDEILINKKINWAFELEIVDNANEENYYILDGYFDFAIGQHDDGVGEVNGYIEPHIGHYTNDPNSDNALLVTALDYEVYPLRGVYLTDKNFNGQTYKTILGLKDWDIVFNPEIDGITAHVFVKSVSKEMYEYQISLEKYRLTQGDIFSQPQLIYSNVDKGLGIFGGYTMQSFEIDLPKSGYLFPSNFFAENEGCTAPCEVKFTAEDGGERLSYLWNFGDGSTSTERNPTHTYNSAGFFEVQVNVSSLGGDSSGSNFGLQIN